jgi:hygromycin-B 4-O-kinase
LHILNELGHYAACINSIPTRGFGGTFDWSHNQLSPCVDWDEFLRREFGLENRLRTLRRLRLVERAKLEKIRAVLESANLKPRAPSLNHGDLRLKNVLVDDKGKISAILDWENSSSNLAPEWELSLALHDLSIDEKEEFLRGYGIPAKSLTVIAPTLKALNVANYVSEIEHLEKNRDESRQAYYRMRLSGALDLYCL